MNIIVCIKQVPASTEMKVDKSTNTTIRENNNNIINPFDLYAIEESVKIKEKLGGKTTAISMGLLSATESLVKSISLGVDEAFLLNDKAFAGADTLATAYTLAKGISKIAEYDLIICGKQAVDGDTSQVGPALAKKLEIPHITCVSKIVQIDNKKLICHRTTDYGYDIVEVKLPALITVSNEINSPRVSTLKNLMVAKKTKITIWSKEDVDAHEDLCGLKGSQTRVVSMQVQNYNKNAIFLNGEIQKQAKELIDILLD